MQSPQSPESIRENTENFTLNFRGILSDTDDFKLKIDEIINSMSLFAGLQQWDISITYWDEKDWIIDFSLCCGKELISPEKLNGLLQKIDSNAWIPIFFISWDTEYFQWEVIQWIVCWDSPEEQLCSIVKDFVTWREFLEAKRKKYSDLLQLSKSVLIKNDVNDKDWIAHMQKFENQISKWWYLAFLFKEDISLYNDMIDVFEEDGVWTWQELSKYWSFQHYLWNLHKKLLKKIDRSSIKDYLQWLYNYKENVNTSIKVILGNKEANEITWMRKSIAYVSRVWMSWIDNDISEKFKEAAEQDLYLSEILVSLNNKISVNAASVLDDTKVHLEFINILLDTSVNLSIQIQNYEKHYSQISENKAWPSIVDDINNDSWTIQTLLSESWYAARSMLSSFPFVPNIAKSVDRLITPEATIKEKDEMEERKKKEQFFSVLFSLWTEIWKLNTPEKKEEKLIYFNETLNQLSKSNNFFQWITISLKDKWWEEIVPALTYSYTRNGTQLECTFELDINNIDTFLKRKKDINMSAMLLSFISQWVLFNTIENYTYNTDWSKKNFITISWKKHDSTQLNFDALNDMTRLSWYWNWIKTVYRRGSWDSDGAIYLSFEMSKNEVETKFLSEWLEWCEGVKNWLWDILYIWLAPMLPLEVNEPFWKWSWDFFVCNAEKQEKNILSSNDENDDQELRVELMNKKTGVKTPAYGYINSKAQFIVNTYWEYVTWKSNYITTVFTEEDFDNYRKRWGVDIPWWDLLITNNGPYSSLWDGESLKGATFNLPVHQLEYINIKELSESIIDEKLKFSNGIVLKDINNKYHQFVKWLYYTEYTNSYDDVFTSRQPGSIDMYGHIISISVSDFNNITKTIKIGKWDSKWFSTEETLNDIVSIAFI